MIKKVAIVGIVIGALGLAGCKCEGQQEGQATNTAAVDSLTQVISSLEQELNTVKQEKEQCEAELESLKASATQTHEKKQGGDKSKPRTAGVEEKVDLSKDKPTDVSERPKKAGARKDVPVDLNR